MAVRPAMEGPVFINDARRVGDGTSSNALTEFLDKGSEDMAGNAGAQPSRTSKLLGLQSLCLQLILRGKKTYTINGEILDRV